MMFVYWLNLYLLVHRFYYKDLFVFEKVLLDLDFYNERLLYKLNMGFYLQENQYYINYSTVTDFAKFLG